MEWLGDNLWAAWLSGAALLVIGELLTVDLVLLMMAGGALSGAGVSFFSDSWVLQVVVAIAVTVALLAAVRPSVVARLHRGPDLLVGPERLVGIQAVTPVALSGREPRQIKIDGELWTARPEDDAMVIPPGTTVVVRAIRGATAIVAPRD